MRDLPELEGFYVAEKRLIDFEGNKVPEDEIEAFRKEWERTSAVQILLEVASHNLYFVQNPTVFIDGNWMNADDDVIVLDAIDFRKDLSNPDRPVLRAFMPLRNPIRLSRLLVE